MLNLDSLQHMVDIGGLLWVERHVLYTMRHILIIIVVVIIRGRPNKMLPPPPPPLNDKSNKGEQETFLPPWFYLLYGEDRGQ